MAYDPGALEAALSAAIGDDPVLALELRGAFLASADQHLSTLARARQAEEWQRAAFRLKGLAASFGALDLMRAADLASAAPPADPTALRRIRRLLASFER